MTVTDIACNRANYGSVRQGPVEYLVLHYTAVPGDTAENNGRYFAREHIGASAHYFVDEHTVVRSVPDGYTAWHCGGNYYYHPVCRNGNSIGIEICTKGKNGAYYFAPEALERAKRLARQLMAQYDIPTENVLRHYDVTGKCCPAPFVGQGEAAWQRWKGGLQVYQSAEQVPEWAKKTVTKLEERNLLLGDGNGLNLTEDLLRTLVILDRAGVFEKEETSWKQS